MVVPIGLRTSQDDVRETISSIRALPSNSGEVMGGRLSDGFKAAVSLDLIAFQQSK